MIRAHASLDPCEWLLQVAFVEERQPQGGSTEAMLLRVAALERDLHCRPKIAQGQRSLDSAESRHGDVEQGDPGMLLKAELHCFGAVNR
ncbi:MAG: hypothetical protein ACREEC_09690, partial [Thermoplasmata archaeon]